MPEIYNVCNCVMELLYNKLVKKNLTNLRNPKNNVYNEA